MRLLMASGDRQVTLGERGPFHAMQREFSRYFERVDVICPRPPGKVSVRSIHDNVHFHPAECGRVGMVNYIVQKGSELIGRHGHSLIVSHDYGWFYNGMGSARLSQMTGVPYLSEIHHVSGYPVAGDMRERFDRWVARAYVGWARNRALGFRVVNSEEMVPLLRGWHVRPEQILVLPSLYIDFDIFKPPADLEAVQHDQDIVFVGRMVDNKGVARILEALGILNARGHRTRGLLVGKGPLLTRLRERAQSLGIADLVRFIEWVDSPADLAEIYRKSRICVCASTCEGGPRFTVEAMACGTPVVSTPVGVMAELLVDGKAGELCGFSSHDLASVLERVLAQEELRLRMGRQAIEITRPFEYSAAIGHYANGLRRLIGADEVTAGAFETGEPEA